MHTLWDKKKKESKKLGSKREKNQEGEPLICDYGIVFKTQGKAKCIQECIQEWNEKHSLKR